MSFPTLFFSLPGNKKFFRFHHHPEGEQCFILRPFDGQVSEWKGTVIPAKPSDWNPALVVASRSSSPSKQEYLQRLEKAIEWCKDHKGKLVLSRTWEDEGFQLNPGKALQDLRSKHPNAFVYGLESSEYGCWLGATPETLLERTKDGYRTMALAGTKLKDEAWTAKEEKEQQTVTDFLLERINEELVEVVGPVDSAFGALKHLKSELTWQSDASLLTTAERLHPTPAVGGFPVSDALGFLSQNEAYDRSLYTGYIGLQNSTHDGHLFVNLRCMQLFRDQIRFYAGGGINEWSDPEAEWVETQHKIESTRAVLNAQ